jgi:hypothetical protein
LLRDCEGADSVSDDAGPIEVEVGRLAGRLVGLRVVGRDFGAAERGREAVDRGFAVVARGVELARLVVPRPGEPAEALPEVDALAVREDERRGVELREDAVRDDEARVDALLDEGRVDDVLDDGRVAEARVDVVRRAVDGLRAVVLRAVVRPFELAATGLADDIVLAAAVSAFAAVIMAFVAVFIDFIADDIVCADAVALVAAAVILVAADVTLVAAEDTPLAAVAGVAELRLPRLAVLRRAVVEPETLERDAVDRGAVLRVDRDPALRVVARATVPLAGLTALLRVDRGVALDDLVVELDLGRLAVPLDALRLTDLLRAELAELRRVAARVVD